MAFDYTTSNTGVFCQIGKFIKKLNAYKATATTTYPADLYEIAALFQNASRTDLVSTLYGAYRAYQDGITQQRQALASYVNGILGDPAEVLSQIAALSNALTEVLPKLWIRMTADSKTVNRSAVTVGTVTANAANTGNGTILVTKVLDGYNAPVIGAPVNIGYNGVNSELAVTSETQIATCVADSGRDGLQAGSEQFSWNGAIAYPALDWNAAGSGAGPGLTAAGGANRLTDGDFENWSSGTVPANWAVDAGGSAIAQETSVIYTGSSALKMTGDGSTATIQVSQAIPPAQLKERRMYNVSIRIRGSSGTPPAAGTIGVLFSGTGYSAGGSEQISIAHGSFPGTSWTLYNFFISIPVDLPSDWKLVVKITATLSNAFVVYFDSVRFTEVTYHGGVGAVAVDGSIPFVVGDSFTWTLANDDAGVFQKFFREWFQFQLPSSASPNISDSLAA